MIKSWRKVYLLGITRLIDNVVNNFYFTRFNPNFVIWVIIRSISEKSSRLNIKLYKQGGMKENRGIYFSNFLYKINKYCEPQLFYILNILVIIRTRTELNAILIKKKQELIVMCLIKIHYVKKLDELSDGSDWTLFKCLTHANRTINLMKILLISGVQVSIWYLFDYP